MMCFVLDSSRYNLISAITDDGLRDISKVISNILNIDFIRQLTILN